MADKTEFRNKVRTEIENVKSLVKDLLKKKIERANYTQEKQKEILGTNAPSKNDFGAFVNNLATSIEDVKTELLVAPSSDSVRRIRAILTDAKNAFGKMSTGEIKAVLDELYQLGLLTRFRKYAQADQRLRPYGNHEIGVAVADNSKGYEARKLSFETIMKFVRENSVKYLGRNLYPTPSTAEITRNAKEIIESIEEQQGYVDKEAPLSGTMQAPGNARPAPTNEEIQNYIEQSYAQLPLSKQDEINAVKFFKQFSREELMYTLMAFVKENDFPDMTYADIRQELMDDPAFVDAVMADVYRTAKHNHIRPEYIIREVLPGVRQAVAQEGEAM